MAGLAFPSIAAPSLTGLDETSKDYTRKMEFENDTIATRRGATGNKKTWNLEWPLMKTRDYETLKDFYDNKAYGGANTFTWTYPKIYGSGISGKTYTVRFSSDLKAKTAGYGVWDVTVTLLEA